MKYELALKLKEAGFPQKKFDYRKDKGWFDEDGDRGGWWNGNESTYIPALEELIEACGDMFGSLHNNLGFWQAHGRHSFDPFRENHDTTTEGATPSEAVANLWLVLNKKS